MKINRYDTFFIGVVSAFSISLLIEKDYIGLCIQGFLLGLYFGINWAYSKFVKGVEDE